MAFLGGGRGSDWGAGAGYFGYPDRALFCAAALLTGVGAMTALRDGRAGVRAFEGLGMAPAPVLRLDPPVVT
jgi:hypothetical protein